jgi:hypothetical protein
MYDDDEEEEEEEVFLLILVEEEEEGIRSLMVIGEVAVEKEAPELLQRTSKLPLLLHLNLPEKAVHTLRTISIACLSSDSSGGLE